MYTTKCTSARVVFILRFIVYPLGRFSRSRGIFRVPERGDDISKNSRNVRQLIIYKKQTKKTDSHSVCSLNISRIIIFETYRPPVCKLDSLTFRRI